MPGKLPLVQLRIPNNRLEEGRWYAFRLLKKIRLSEEDERFILEDPLGYKMMMPANWYQAYGFRPGSEILCRVDKINCNGRMFLEPRHPVYSEGEIYDYEALAQHTEEALPGLSLHVCRLKDALNQPLDIRSRTPFVFLPEKSENGLPLLRCRLQRIKKGRLFLQPVSSGGFLQYMDDADYHQFQITAQLRYPPQGPSAWMLRDKTGVLHLLYKKHYLRYGFRLNQKIECRLRDQGVDGFAGLEPRHPHYEPGEVYDFQPLRIEKQIFSDGSHQMVLVLRESLGEEIKWKLSEETINRLKHQQRISARVRHIVKSRPELQLP